MNYFKLVDGIRSPQSIDVVRSENGYKKFGWIRVLPDERYPLGTMKHLFTH